MTIVTVLFVSFGWRGRMAVTGFDRPLRPGARPMLVMLEVVVVMRRRRRRVHVTSTPLPVDWFAEAGWDQCRLDAECRIGHGH
jgi:hypothetical protein